MNSSKKPKLQHITEDEEMLYKSMGEVKQIPNMTFEKAQQCATRVREEGKLVGIGFSKEKLKKLPNVIPSLLELTLFRVQVEILKNPQTRKKAEALCDDLRDKLKFPKK